MSVLTDLERLREIAVDQHGLVTSAQAVESGVSLASLSMMVRRDRLEKISRGLFRVPQVPATQYDSFMQAVLWTGFPEACVSHDSALDAWEISDINPDRIHLTVAARRRITRQIPHGYTVHHQDLLPEQVTWWEGIPTVTAATAIRQCLASGVPTYLIRQAIERSARIGLVPAAELEGLTQLLEARYVRQS
ncbi:MAG: type IV toxin-antitoxin system AbiEi family antitoxin domain-containing protein [Propionibacteriaceae bacterium]|nr:type IV toxin-antitoxin system AbiEi family antitoxin domain-containing protein [Propionibacteriaceae bacterium]